jgi:uncharacterized protein YbaR (Trm112 family)
VDEVLKFGTPRLYCPDCRDFTGELEVPAETQLADGRTAIAGDVVCPRCQTVLTTFVTAIAE